MWALDAPQFAGATVGCGCGRLRGHLARPLLHGGGGRGLDRLTAWVMAYIVMAYIAMGLFVMAYTAVACIVTAY